MTEPGGPTTQSGILYQNSVAALFLANMLDDRPVHRKKRALSVRVEAPEHVDDIVVSYCDGSTRYVQAKERLKRGRVWKEMWCSVAAQWKATPNQLDGIEIAVGNTSGLLENLSELCDRSAGKETETEWCDALSKEQKALLGEIEEILPEMSRPEIMVMLRSVTLNIRTWHDIQRRHVPETMPLSSVSSEALFSALRDSCGGGARVRQNFTALALLDQLKSNNDIIVSSSGFSRTDEYRLAIARRYGSISVPGTSLSGPLSSLFLWPRLVNANRSGEGTMEDDVLRRKKVHEDEISLKEFPSSDMLRLVIEAGAGFGKTTLLQAIACRLAQETIFVPVVIYLDSLAGKEILDFLDNINRQFRVSIDWDLLCSQGRVVLLLDGLDELSDQARTSVLGAISRLSSRYPEVPFCLTVRDAAILTPPDGCRVLEIDRLRDNDIRRFLANYLSLKPGIQAHKILAALNRSEDTSQLARIPLFLALLAATLGPSEVMPRGRAGIIEHYLSVVLSPERYKEGHSVSDVPSDLRDAIEAIARLALSEGSISVEERMAARKLDELFPQHPPQTYIVNAVRCGLCRRGYGRLSFHYPIVQEYLAGCWLAENEADEAQSWFGRVARRPWAQALQFAIERLPDADALLRAELGRADDVYWRRLRLIARSIINGARVSPEVREQVARRLAIAWPTGTFGTRDAIGDLIIDGFSQPLTPELRNALVSARAPSPARSEIILKSGNSEVALETMRNILATNDIRDLWNNDFISALAPVSQEAIEEITARAADVSSSQLDTEVAADAILNLSQKVSFPWSKIIDREELPPTVRLAAYVADGRKIEGLGINLVEEVLRAGRRVSWSKFPEIYLSMEGWQDHLRGMVQGRLGENLTIYSVADAAVRDSPEKREFKRCLKDLLEDNRTLPRYRDQILRVLMVLGDSSAAEGAAAVALAGNSQDVLSWLYNLHHVDDDLALRSIVKARSRRFSTARQVDMVKAALFGITARTNGVTSAFGSGNLSPRRVQNLNKAVEIWANALLGRPLSPRQKINLLAVLVQLTGKARSDLLAKELSSLLDSIDSVSDEDWNLIMDATRALQEIDFTLAEDMVWDIINKAPNLPIWSFVEAAAKFDKERGFEKIVSYYNSTNSSEGRFGVLYYFEREAPRLGLTIQKIGGKLTISH